MIVRFWQNEKGIALLAGACALALLTAGVAAMRMGVFAPAVQRTSATAFQGGDAVEAEDPIAAFRAEREELRTREKAQLNEIVYAGDADAGTRAAARRQVMQLCDREDRENTLEGLLRLRGYEEAVCTVRGNSVNVMVRAEVLTRQESAVIYDLVLRETGVAGGNVKIIPIR